MARGRSICAGKILCTCGVQDFLPKAKIGVFFVAAGMRRPAKYSLHRVTKKYAIFDPAKSPDLL
jgi:hypothetical protein